MNPSTALGNKVIIAVQRECPRARVFRRVVSNVHPIGQPHIIMEVGIKGQADIWGFALSTGPRAVPFEIELKVGRDRESEAQRNWRELCRSLGVPHLVLAAPDKNDFSKAVAEAVSFVKNL